MHQNVDLAVKWYSLIGNKSLENIFIHTSLFLLLKNSAIGEYDNDSKLWFVAKVLLSFRDSQLSYYRESLFVVL